MASKPIVFGVSNAYGSYIQGKIELSSTPETVSNTSDVTASIYVRKGDHDGPLTIPTGGSWYWDLTVNGSKKAGSTYASVLEDWVLLYTGTWNDIVHGSDGSKSISVSGSVSGPTETSYSGKTSSGSGTFNLDTIPRASGISSAGDTSLGSACSVKWTPKAASFRYKLRFALESWSYTTGAIHPNSTAAYTYTGYTIPYEVANQLTEATGGTMTVTLYTYSDSDAKVLVGEDSDAFQVTIPDNSKIKPTVEFSIVDSDDLPSAFEGLYIQGKSRVQGYLSASGQYGASISSLKMNVGGVEYSSPFLSALLYQAGSITVKGVATDSRGFSQVSEETITVQAYSRPQVVLEVCGRCDENVSLDDSGVYLRVKATRSWSQIGGKNLCLLRFRWRIASVGDAGYSDWITLLARGSSGNTYDAIIPDITFDATLSYVVQVGVVDDIGEAIASTQTIPSEKVWSQESEDGISYGMYRSMGGFESAWASHFYGNVDGRVWGLGELPQIQSGANVNDYLEPGVWGAPASVATEIANWPTDSGGTLIVKYGDGLKRDDGKFFYITQIVDDYMCQHRYVRTLFTTTIAGQFDITQWYQPY